MKLVAEPFVLEKRGPIDVKGKGEMQKEGLVRYQVSKTNGGPSYHEWPAAEFVGRVATLVPPARKHVVRYYGAWTRSAAGMEAGLSKRLARVSGPDGRCPVERFLRRFGVD